MDGRYIYCITDGRPPIEALGGRQDISLGNIGLPPNVSIGGIEKAEGYTIPFRSLLAVVHNCEAKAYNSDDEDAVINRIITHQQVVDEAWKRFGTALPISFNTIIKGGAAHVRAWLKQEYESLCKKIERFRGRAEYGIQIFWDIDLIAGRVVDRDTELKELQREITSPNVSIGDGATYMYKQKFEKRLRDEIEAETEVCFKKLYNQIKAHVEDIFVEKTKTKQGNTQMLMNLSCLVPKDRRRYVGEELEKISSADGFSVRFTGPWPPYSFVGLDRIWNL